MLVDANVLLYAVDRASPFHGGARDRLERHLNGTTRIGLPWPSLTAFVRISTHPRVFTDPLTTTQAWQQVTDFARFTGDLTWIDPLAG